MKNQEKINKINPEKPEKSTKQILPEDLVIINQIASFFEKYENEARKILIDHYQLIPGKAKGLIIGKRKVEERLI